MAESELIPYNALTPGFLIVAWTAHHVFFWLGDLQGIRLLQILTHLGLCWLLVRLLPTCGQRLLFLILYAANPLVIHFVTFPFYYFWQVLPSAGIAWALLYPGRVRTLWSIALGVALALAFAIRPTTILVCAGCAAFWVWRQRTWASGLAVTLFVAGIALSVVLRHGVMEKFHTPYVGIGAYKNPWGIEFSDHSARERFELKTGINLDFDLGGNFYEDAVRVLYNKCLREDVLRYLAQHPWLFARNACLNTAQGFSMGFLTKGTDTVHLLVAASGIFVVVVLLYCGQWQLVSANLLALASFAPYVPPIPAYMFGSYLLLAVAVVKATGHLRTL